jgi:tight adherence protein B
MIVMGLAALGLGAVGLTQLLGATRNRVRRRAEAIASKYSARPAAAGKPVQGTPTIIREWVSELMGPERIQREADLLAGADWALWPGEFVTLRLASAAGWAVMGLLCSDWVVVPAVLAVLGYYAPYAHVAARRRRRRALFERQLPHMIQLVVSSLRSGSSFAPSHASRR